MKFITDKILWRIDQSYGTQGTLEDFFNYNDTDRNLEIYLNDPLEANIFKDKIEISLQ